MPRRKDNEIYSYKLKSGKVKFGFKTYLGIDKESGKAVKVTRQGFGSRKEAESAKIKLKATGATTEAKRANAARNEKTMTDVWKAWLPIYSQSVKGITVFQMTKDWRLYIKPEFGRDYVRHISVDHVQKFANRMAKNYVEYQQPVALLKRLFKYAIRRGWCSKSPFDRVVVPKKSGKKSQRITRNYYTREELAQFLEAAKVTGLKQYLYFSILATLGLRRSEALALRWQDIDLKHKTVTISNTVTIDSNGRKSIGSVKTAHSHRQLILSDKLVSILQEYAKYYRVPHVDYVFYNGHFTFYGPCTGEYWIKKVYKTNPDLRRITPHGLRHTLATLLYEGDSRVTPKDVQYVLGHSKPTTALQIYTHVTDQQKKNISSSIKHLGL